MTNKTALELAKILDDFASKINTRYNAKLNRITKFGDARDQFKRKLGADGMITLLSKTDQNRLMATWKRYLVVSESEDLETQELIKKYNRISGNKS